MKLVRRLIDLVLIGVLVVCLYKIVDKIQQYNKADTVYNSISLEKEEGKKIEDINEDYRGWIKIKNTNIDYPILQAKDNDYYLNKDINKQQLDSGSIFMDYLNNNEFNSKNTIIFGHNMKNGTMFGELKKYKDESFFRENNNIEIETKDGEKINYKIFSVYIASSQENYIKTQFETNEEFREYLERAEIRSMYKTDIPLSESDKIITLSTCSYEQEDGRLVIHAKREN